MVSDLGELRLCAGRDVTECDLIGHLRPHLLLENGARLAVSRIGRHPRSGGRVRVRICCDHTTVGGASISGAHLGAHGSICVDSCGDQQQRRAIGVYGVLCNVQTRVRAIFVSWECGRRCLGATVWSGMHSRYIWVRTTYIDHTDVKCSIMLCEKRPDRVPQII